MIKDYDQLARFEKAIQKKYGPTAVVNPKSGWNDEKEREYLKSLKSFYGTTPSTVTQKIKVGDIFISKAFLEGEESNTCLTCEKYSMSRRDDVYMTKFQCCMECYFEYVDGREQRWTDGWRPEKKDLNPKTT